MKYKYIRLRRFKWIGMKFGKVVLQVHHAHRMTESESYGTFKMGAMTSFHVSPQLAAAYAAVSAGCPLAGRARVTSLPA